MTQSIHKIKLNGENWVKAFFGSTAVVSVVLISLITLFLLKEGLGFFGSYQKELALYRESGMEFAEVVSEQHNSLTLIYRYLENILANESKFFEELPQNHHLYKVAQIRKEKLFKLTRVFQSTKETLLDYEKEIVSLASQTKAFLELQGNISNWEKEARKLNLTEPFLFEFETVQKRDHFTFDELNSMKFYFIRNDANDLAKQVESSLEISGLSFEKPLSNKQTKKILKSLQNVYLPLINIQEKAFRKLIDQERVEFSLESSINEFENTKGALQEYLDKVPNYVQVLDEWDPNKSFPMDRAFTSFFFGKKWVTNSARQDWFGVVPLLTGSLLITFIAIIIAVPLGLGSAIYISQSASKFEQGIVKPFIEFIAAIPSILIGFFGISVLGGFINEFADERLNSLTAGCLLALMATPTIFTLAEDALNRSSLRLRQASLALGANRWQTCYKIIIPSSTSGMISAVLLGFGRVIGETMVVLLCAGNRIAIPDFSRGLEIFAQPVHTMTGIIAQEMGEVEYEGIHYRALFMVGITLFMITLLINFLSKKVSSRLQRSHK